MLLLHCTEISFCPLAMETTTLLRLFSRVFTVKIYCGILIAIIKVYIFLCYHYSYSKVNRTDLGKTGLTLCHSSCVWRAGISFGFTCQTILILLVNPSLSWGQKLSEIAEIKLSSHLERYKMNDLRNTGPSYRVLWGGQQFACIIDFYTHLCKEISSRPSS